MVISLALSASDSIHLWDKVKHTKAEKGGRYLACSWTSKQKGWISALFEIKTHKLLILELKRNLKEDFPDGSIVDHAVDLGKDFAPIKLEGTIIEAWHQSGPSLPSELIERLYKLQNDQTIEIDGSLLTVCSTDGMTTDETGGYVSLVCSPRESWRSRKGPRPSQQP